MSNPTFLIETIAIGDELLTGKTADTNSTFVGNALFGVGLSLSRVSLVPDTTLATKEVIKEAAKRANAVVVFGGLGPTSDDKTAEAVAELTLGKLVEDAPTKERLLAYLKERKRDVTAPTLKQVLYPSTATPIQNYVGLATGFRLRFEGCEFFFLPGVPTEMKAMFQESVFPEIRLLSGNSEKVQSHVWRTIGIPEAELQRLMSPIEKALPEEGWLGYRTRFPENFLYLYQRGEKNFSEWEEKISGLLTPYCYSRTETELEEAVLELLKKKKLTLATAESCTGGLVAQRLTRVSGASDHVWGGLVTYQVAAKNKLLGLKIQTSEEAVSQTCSDELAESTLKLSGVDIAVSVTGYMGPTGGTAHDPIGTSYTSVLSREGKSLKEKVVLPARFRNELQWGTSSYVLNTVLKLLRVL